MKNVDFLDFQAPFPVIANILHTLYDCIAQDDKALFCSLISHTLINESVNKITLHFLKDVKNMVILYLVGKMSNSVWILDWLKLRIPLIDNWLK